MTEIQRLEADIARSEAKVERLSKQLREAEKKGDETAIKNAEKRLNKEYELLDVAKDRLDAEKSIQKSVNSQLTTFTRLTKGVKEKLAGDSKSADLLKSQLVVVGRLKAEQQLLAQTEEQSNDILDARLDYFESLTSEIISQAKQNETLEEKLKGQTDFEREKLEVASTYNSLKKELNQKIQDEIKKTGKTLSLSQIKSGFGGIELKEKLLLLESLDEEEQKVQELLNLKQKQILYGQRLEAIEQNRSDLNEMIPESMKGAFGFAKKLTDQLIAGGPTLVAFTVLVGLLGAMVSAFTKLDEAAKGFREETGLTRSQTKELDKDVNNIVSNFSQLGVDAEKVYGVASALKSEFADISSFSEQTLSALTVLGTNFGVSADAAAKTQAILENIGGLSSETAASVQLQVANMANLAGVAPAKIIEDIAENAEIASTFFKGDVNALAKAAVEARRLGTNIARTAEVAEGLLDFESGISEELATAAMLGGDFNLTRARALAFEGKTVEAQKEILAQIQKTGDFREKDYFTQQQIAKATGMSVDEINKQLNIQQKLNSLSSEQRALAEQAIAQGLDISNINKEDLATQVQTFSKQQEQQAVLEQVSNQFMGIVATVGSELVPLLQLALQPVILMAEGLNSIVRFVKEYAGVLGTIAGIMGTVWAIQKGIVLWQRKEAVLRLINIKRAAAVASLSALSNPVKALAGLAVAGLVVGLASRLMSKAGDLSSPAGGKTVVSTKEGGLFELSPNDDVVAAPGAAAALAGGGGNLSAPLNAVVNEIRGLRNDMASGKIRVFMDGKEVTAGVARVVSRSGRNSFIRK